MKTKITMLWMIALAIFVQTSAHAQIFLSADLAVTNLAVTSVNGNTFTFNYTVKNIANFASLDLSRLYFQNYVSTDAVLSTATDKPAGGSIFGNSAPILGPGQSYTGSWTSNPGFSIETYHYLIFDVKLRPGYTSQETNLANNRLAKNLTPSFADLAVTNIVVNSVNGNSYSYTYTIRNNGASILYLDRHYFQAYISADAVLDAADAPAGGSIFSTSPLPLAPGATYTGTWSNTSTVPLQTNPYLIFDVRLYTGVSPQITLANDRYVKYLLPSFADLIVSDIQVNNINGNSIDFNYTIKNQGNSILYLNRHYFQAYVSPDAVLNPTTDAPAGGSLFSSIELPIAPGATYTGHWTSTVSVPLQQNYFLIFDVRLLNTFVSPQISLTNDRYFEYLPNSFADLIVSDISINEATTNKIDFNYTIKNQGASILYLDRQYFQAYVSQNSTLEIATDIPAGGSIFSSTALPIAPGATYTGRWVSNFSVPQQNYPYLIFDVRLNPGQVQPQQSLNNDRYVKYVTPTISDLAITEIKLDSVSGTLVDLQFTVTNQGTSVLNLNQNYFQTYLSQNATLEVASDPQVDNDVFTNGGLTTLLPGQSLTFISVFNTTIDLDVYQYAIIELRVLPGQVQPDVNLANNRRAQYLPVFFPDIYISDVLYQSVNNGTTISYETYVGNSGLTYVHLNNYRLRAYFSVDTMYDASDILADEATFQGPLNDPIIQPGSAVAAQSTTKNTTAPVGYNYFIVRVEPVTTPKNYERSYYNNHYVTLLPAILANGIGTSPSRTEGLSTSPSRTEGLGSSPSYHVEKVEEVLSLENVAEPTKNTSYILYSISGEKISEGEFKDKKEVNTNGLQYGIYVLKLNDGSNTETVKFAIQ